jgi:hypothetical protein
LVPEWSQLNKLVPTCLRLKPDAAIRGTEQRHACTPFQPGVGLLMFEH